MVAHLLRFFEFLHVNDTITITFRKKFAMFFLIMVLMFHIMF